ncbi:MAG: PKD domain-containing protein [Candidatus Bathyarchaeota archaeon]|nr:PKD domain-containing protein [Candidatus Bathyarchaeota archaeon]
MKRGQIPTIALTLMLILTAASAASVFSGQVYAQTGSIVINSGEAYTNATKLALTLFSSNAVQMRFSNDNSSWSDWETYATQINYTLTEGDKEYTIYVEFQDSLSQTSTASASIILDTTPPEPAAYADWYTSDYKTVYFDASYSTDNFGIASFTWDFGDGNVTSGVTVIHRYAAVGNYTVTLSALDHAGNNGSTTLLARIPDVTATPNPTVTPTPAPTTYIPPSTNPTVIPTASPTPTPSGFDSTWTIAMVGVVVIVVIGAIIILLLRKRSKTP